MSSCGKPPAPGRSTLSEDLSGSTAGNYDAPAAHCVGGEGRSRVADGSRRVADDSPRVSNEAWGRRARERGSPVRVRLSREGHRDWRTAGDAGVPREDSYPPLDECLRSNNDCHQPSFDSLQPSFKGGKRPSKLGLRGSGHREQGQERRAGMLSLELGRLRTQPSLFLFQRR